MSPATRWSVAIVGLLAGNVIAMVVLIGASSTGRSQVIPDYYERAVHYDDAIEQNAKNVALGWKVVAHWNGTLVADVFDRDGRPLTGARVRIDHTPRVHGQKLGPQDVTITVERGGDVFVERTTVEAR